MMRRQLVWIISIVVIGAVIAYLYPVGVVENREPPAQIGELFGEQWILRTIVTDGQVSLSAATTITIQFDEDGTATGFGGCNTFFGEYLTTDEYQIVGKSGDGEEQTGVGGSIVLGPIAQTERACLEPNLMDQENRFFAALNQVTSFQLLSESLKLASEDEQTSLTFGLE